MGNKIRRIFCPTLEEKKEDWEKLKNIYNEQIKDHGCSTCIHCIHIINYPGFVTGEENECNAGLECDTVLFSVKNCPKWEKRDLISLKEFLKYIQK